MITTPRCSVCNTIAGPLAPIPDGRSLCPECLGSAGCVSWEVPEGWMPESRVEQPIAEPTKPRKQLALF
jgi:hypothetical protein